MKKYFFLIAALFMVGAFLRVWRIDSVPIALFGDEIDVGLQAYSILTTGKDYLGNKFPILFHSFSEYRLPMQLYLDVPFINLLGLSTLGVRAPAVLMGFASILAFFLLTKELFGKRVGIISALFMTFSPWHFNFSRQANDAGILLPFVIFGTYFFMKGRADFKYLVFSAITFSISFYAYAISSLFTPLFVLGLFTLFRRELFSYGAHKLALVALTALIVLSPYIHKTITGYTTRRISQISLTTQSEIEGEVAFAREIVGGVFGRVYYNKVTVIFSKLFENFTQAVSPSFLFSKGDANPRHSIPGYGQMYFFDFVLILIGLAIAILSLSKNKNIRTYALFLLWLLIAPIPSIVTRGGGTHAARLILMLPSLTLFSALGFNHLMDIKGGILSRVILVLVFVVMIFEVSRFMNRYFLVWPKESWRFWHYGFEETISFVKREEANYQKIIFNNTYEPMLPRFLFWYGYDMGFFHRQFEGDVHTPNILPGLDGFKLTDKYYFGDLKKPIEALGHKDTMVIASAEKDATNPDIFENSNLKLLETINSPDGRPIFYIFTEKQ